VAARDAGTGWLVGRRRAMVVGLARLGAAFVVATTVAFALGNLPRSLDQLGDRARRNSTLSYVDRDIAGGNSILPDQLAAYEARTRIPEHETYRVVVGEHLTRSTPFTRDFVDDWLIYFLMPRRPSPSAVWIVCVGCDEGQLGGRYHILWQDEVGISVGSLVR
jgi:hypothetical protein